MRVVTQLGTSSSTLPTKADSIRTSNVNKDGLVNLSDCRLVDEDISVHIYHC